MNECNALQRTIDDTRLSIDIIQLHGDVNIFTLRF